MIGDAGQPIAGAEVLALAGSTSHKSRIDVLAALGAGGAKVASTRSGAGGRFELIGLPGGEVTVAAHAGVSTGDPRRCCLGRAALSRAPPLVFGHLQV